MRSGKRLAVGLGRHQLETRVLDEAQRGRGIPAAATLKYHWKRVARFALAYQAIEILGRAERRVADRDDQIVAIDACLVPG